MNGTATDSLRVVHLVDAAEKGNHIWGKEKMILDLTRAQKESGAVVPQVLTFASCRLAEKAVANGVRCLSLSSFPRRPLGYLITLRQLMRCMRPDVLHTHCYKANVVGRMLRLIMTDGPPLVSTCHGWIDTTARLRFYNHLDRATARLSDIVTVPAHGMENRFGKHCRVRVIPNGTNLEAGNLDRSRARTRFAWPPSAFVVGFLGRFSWEKGLDVFAGAASLDTRHENYWVAAGAEMAPPWLKAEASASWSAVGFLDNPIAFLLGLDVFVQASRSEGLSLALLEAAAAARPIVATAVGATSEVLRHEMEALLIETDSPVALLAAVERLKRDPPFSAELGQRARRRVLERFSIEDANQSYISIYQEVTKSNRIKKLRSSIDV